MEIKIYVQGTDSDRELFAQLGRLLTDETVHKLLGMAITSRPDDVWLLATDIDCGVVLGFLLARRLKSKPAFHIRFLYCTEKSVCSALLTQFMAKACTDKARSVHTNDRETNAIWREFGFKKRRNNRRGLFVRWEKDIKGGKK